jgi:hypothetical protein
VTKKSDYAFYGIGGAVLLGGVLVLAVAPRGAAAARRQ